MEVANTLTYYDTAAITVVKSFTEQAWGDAKLSEIPGATSFGQPNILVTWHLVIKMRMQGFRCEPYTHGLVPLL
jgi:hypothetical protein